MVTMKTVKNIIALVSLSGASASWAFVTPHGSSQYRSVVQTSTSGKGRPLFAVDESSREQQQQERRDFLGQSAAILAGLSTASGLGFSIPSPVFAEEGDSKLGSSPEHPIVILGAGGKCGLLCTEILAKKGLYTRAVTRSGRTTLTAGENPTVSYAAGDVTNYDSVKAAVQGASGVIFAASASGKNKGGDPAHVDYLGVYNTATACVECSVPKLAVISAGTVTRPESAGFKATNFFVKFVYGEGIMDYKIAGESLMRDLYKEAKKPGVAYTVIRPGGLSDKPSVGSTNVHVSQGDVYSSEVTREDVALVTVAALLAGKSTDYTTFELNQKEGLGKSQGNLPDSPAELVHAGAPTFEGLVEGLLTDEEIKSKYPDLISGFRGDKIIPIQQLIA